MPATVDNKGIHSGWSTDEDNWGALMNQNLRVISALVMSSFAQDLFATSGLTYGFRPGKGINAAGLVQIDAGTLTLPANATSYIVRTVAGVVSSQTSGSFPDRIHLATVITNVSNIVSIVDERYVQDISQDGTLTARTITSVNAVNAAIFNGSGAGLALGTVPAASVATLAAFIAATATNFTAVNNAATAAQNTANTGVADAATAQGTANGAVTDAATAQAQANAGVTNAATAQAAAVAAQGTADTGVTNAATAQGAANTAQGAANTAQSSANTAQGSATTALTNANNAATAASNAQGTADTGVTNAAAALAAANAAQTTANGRALAVHTHNASAIDAGRLEAERITLPTINPTGAATGIQRPQDGWPAYDISFIKISPTQYIPVFTGFNI